ncbi:MAG TPA: hypothetical protein VKD71_00755, partial [Gemmataceae bacterium]|nr:hypothetical protein [Gemmataceae bacterium]
MLPLPPEGSFTHLFLSGGSEELESIIRDLGLAEQVSRSLPQPGSADAAVLLDGSHPPLRQVAQCLKAEGLLYWQFSRRGLVHFRRTTTRILEQVRAAGLSPIGLYWVRPESGLPRVFVPLDVSGAISWYLDTFSGRRGELAFRFPRLSRVLAAATARRIG